MNSINMPMSQKVNNVQKGQPQLQKSPKYEDISVLEQKKYFKIVLIDGEELEAKYLSGGQYYIEVETEKGILMIPKHSVKYYAFWR